MKPIQKENNVAGIIPCAGLGTRLGLLPFSKELFPIGQKKYRGKEIPKAACDYLIDHMSDAGVKNIHFVLRKGKWDIPAYFGGGLNHDLNFCYHIADYGYGVPFSVNQIFPFSKDKNIILGFPDILFRPKNAYQKLLQELENNSKTDIVLGVMPVLRPDKWDMVELDDKGNITDLIIKSDIGKLYPYGWTIAAWKPRFSAFLNHRISTLLRDKTKEELKKNEIYFGHIILDAIKKGMKVRSVIFKTGKCLDIGTSEDLSYSKSFLNEEIDKENYNL